jgi:hypothetical protein
MSIERTDRYARTKLVAELLVLTLLSLPSHSTSSRGRRRKTVAQEKWTKIAKVGMGLLLVFLACSVTPAQDVTSNSMPGTDFTKYKTYKWVTIQGASYPNQIVDVQIKNAIDSQLSAKGLTKTDSDKADLLIGYQVSIDHEREWNAYGTGGGLRWGGGMANATSSTISIGTLVLDMYDPASKQLVWTGRATKTIDPGAKEEKKLKNLNKAVEKLLKNFPNS